MAEILLRDYEDEYGNLNVIGNGNLSAAVVLPKIAEAKGQHLTVRIASVGGSVFNGLAIYNALLEHGDVTTINEGYAMSIAALISMAGKVRQTYSSSMFMIHKASLFAFGGMNADDMRKEADSLDVADRIMAKVLSNATGISETDIMNALSEETFYTGFDAKTMGFFTDLIDGETQSIAQASYQRITANQPHKMVALLDKTLKVKQNNMSVIDELKAQHEENKGFFAELKALFTGKPKAEGEEPKEEETVENPKEEEATEEVVDVEALKAENAQLKQEAEDAKASLAEAKAMMAETKTLLSEVRSNYKPAAEVKEFASKPTAEDKPERFKSAKK